MADVEAVIGVCRPSNVPPREENLSNLPTQDNESVKIPQPRSANTSLYVQEEWSPSNGSKLLKSGRVSRSERRCESFHGSKSTFGKPPRHQSASLSICLHGFTVSKISFTTTSANVVHQQRSAAMNNSRCGFESHGGLLTVW